MMKRKIALIILIIVLAAIGFLGYSVYERLEEEQAVAERTALLPDFELTSLKGQMISSRENTEARPLIITYFNTGCKFCQTETRSIKQHELLIERAKIYLISDEPLPILEQFANEFQLDSLQNTEILLDKSSKVKELFGVKGVPNTFVYDEDGKLLENFKGETRAETLYELVNR